MRITGGTAKGQQLKIPKSKLVRPTTDRVRQAIFSMLASFEGGWDRGLDLFAGTGALGIEALSRDIGWVDFVDLEPRCCAIIKQNLDSMGFTQRAHVYCCSVNKALSFIADQYDIILMDPPYADKTLEDILLQFDNARYIDERTMIVIPHSSRTFLADRYGRLSLAKMRRHGDTSISIYFREGDN
jgi:16S rRNA (guanine(966)-N(2))-methyltransferase RsmD